MSKNKGQEWSENNYSQESERPSLDELSQLLQAEIEDVKNHLHSERSTISEQTSKVLEQRSDDSEGGLIDAWSLENNRSWSDYNILNYFTKLTVEQAHEFQKVRDLTIFQLNGLSNLDPDVAAVLAQTRGITFQFNGLLEFKPEVAKQLASCSSLRHLYLNGIQQLSLESIQELSASRSLFTIDLKGLTSMSLEEAKALLAIPNLYDVCLNKSINLDHGVKEVLVSAGLIYEDFQS